MFWTWLAIIVWPIIVILVYDRFALDRMSSLENNCVAFERYMRSKLKDIDLEIEHLKSLDLQNEQLIASLWADVVGYEGSDDPIEDGFVSLTEHKLKERWRIRPKYWRVQMDNVLYEYSRLVKKPYD
ncbi:hypothetical protein [Sandarakinorhabdus limnophila]|uniref:hypothetical protein n=1 Tax=Sandarakinorhabdus limnophila TaxID=210512 RepID=UPI0026EA65FE|nr:hypothetical protein [Sandarakinorhabdus limnophila]MCM0031392.1 hypothetical protein [Sandarakinorhabdus limnophila]